MLGLRLFAFGASLAVCAALACLPHAASALGSTPVTVANPATNPALTSDIDNPGRSPLESVADQSGACSGNSCTFTFGASVGQRLVVQNISGVVSFAGTPSAVLISVQRLSAQTITAFTAQPVPSATFATFNQPVLFYVDSGETVDVVVIITGASGAAFAGDHEEQVVTLSGSAVNCSVANCAPIVH